MTPLEAPRRTLGNLEVQPLRAVTNMLSPGAIGKIQSPDCKGENQNNLNPRAMLRMQSPAAMGKHYTQEHFGKRKTPSLWVVAKMLSPGAI